MRNILFMRATYCHTLVSPGTGAALQHFLAARALIRELLPVLG
jgi:hypothetical protein